LSFLYKKFLGNNLDIHFLSANASQSNAARLRQSFPLTHIIADIEHVRAGSIKKWSSKIVGGKAMQTQITYWLHLLYHTRMPTNFCNAFSVLMNQQEMGEEEFSNFLQQRYGPSGLIHGKCVSIPPVALSLLQNNNKSGDIMV
jgi:hypothetical protein